MSASTKRLRSGKSILSALTDDPAYGAEHIQLRDRGLDAATTEFDWPSFATPARALGGAGIEVASVSDWPSVEAALEQLEGPLLIELKLHPDEMPRMRV